MNKTLRVMIYDETTLKDGWDGVKEDGLALSWKYGAVLYSTMKELDLVVNSSTWVEALTKLLNSTKDCQIKEIQFWGHGSPGAAYIGRDKLDIFDLLKGDREEEGALLMQLKSKLTKDAVIWFRTCGTFAGDKGHEFAKELSTMLDCRVAGHTHIIHVWQAGLHTLKSGQTPHWPLTEGIKRGTPSRIFEMERSMPFVSPNGISCLTSKIPKGW